MPFVNGASASVWAPRSSGVVLDFDDGVSSADRRSPEFAVAKVAERADESIKLARQGVRGMLESECVELPSVGGVVVHEVENALG